MKKTLTTLGIIAVLAICAAWMIKGYNAMVAAEEITNDSWANVESQYQRRSDLIPNLVQTVKGYAAHESSTLEAVIAARAAATQTKISPDDLSEANLQAFQEAQNQVGSALNRLMLVVERYPDLKANENFKALQEQLEGTENRIQVARMDFNGKAKEFNTLVRKFPNNILASIFGFSTKAYFEAAEGADKAPAVQF